MGHEHLKQHVLKANLAIVEAGLVKLTWGNASGVDRKANVMVIKPSGVPYEKLAPHDMVVLSLETGEVVEGKSRPSSDTPTHLHLYQKFLDVGGIVHTHSMYGTIFAQAQRDIVCLGTTHADNFHGTIPCVRPLTESEIHGDYELNTGRVIAEHFRDQKIDPNKIPGALVASHAPFAWGETLDKAVENAIVLEFAAQMALSSLALNPEIGPIPQVLLDKHFHRKHGPKAYYGQTKKV
jgi:L-ribulose-5-phosphate 4-epimerase